MSFGDVFTTEVIVIVGVLLLIGTIIPGIRLYWPRRTDPVSRSDLGVALMGGALIAFAVLVLQLMIQVRAQLDADARQQAADKAEQLLVLGQSGNLSGLDLHDSDLEEAYLNGKVLRGAVLTGANMRHARVQGVDLAAADLTGADLQDAKLDRADLRYADLSGANLARASLKGAKLDGARLAPKRDGDKVVFVNLSRADLSNARVSADLRGADLTGATLVGTRFALANLERADLRGANLLFADFRGANLKGAKLPTADTLFQTKDLSFVEFDAETAWPNDFLWNGKHPRDWCNPECRLPETSRQVTDLDPQLREVRSQLEKATSPQQLDCLPGWWVDERITAIEAHDPLDRARFTVSTEKANRRSAQTIASNFLEVEDEGELQNRDPLDPIQVRGATSKPWAETFEIHDAKQRLTKLGVGVYYVKGRHFFRLWGWAPPEEFRTFQRDFAELFRIMGVSGDLFPALRTVEAGCRA